MPRLIIAAAAQAKSLRVALCTILVLGSLACSPCAEAGLGIPAAARDCCSPRSDCNVPGSTGTSSQNKCPNPHVGALIADRPQLALSRLEAPELFSLAPMAAVAPTDVDAAIPVSFVPPLLCCNRAQSSVLRI
jgi:hypothetical protein